MACVGEQCAAQICGRRALVASKKTKKVASMSRMRTGIREYTWVVRRTTFVNGVLSMGMGEEHSLKAVLQKATKCHQLLLSVGMGFVVDLH